VYGGCGTLVLPQAPRKVLGRQTDFAHLWCSRQHLARDGLPFAATTAARDSISRALRCSAGTVAAGGHWQPWEQDNTSGASAGSASWKQGPAGTATRAPLPAAAAAAAATPAAGEGSCAVVPRCFGRRFTVGCHIILQHTEEEEARLLQVLQWLKALLASLAPAHRQPAAGGVIFLAGCKGIGHGSGKVGAQRQVAPGSVRQLPGTGR